MKHVKKLSLLLTLLTMLLMLTGCKLTPEKVIEKTNAAVAENAMTKATLMLETDFSTDANGTSSDFQMSAIMNLQLSKEPLSMYSQLQVSLRNGMYLVADLYLLQEDEEWILYLCEDVSGYVDIVDVWTRIPLPFDPSSFQPAEGNGNAWGDVDPAAVTLAEDVPLNGGLTGHRLAYTINGSALQNYQASAENLTGTLDVPQLDLSALSIPMELYVDTETYLPIYMKLSIEGLNEAMESLLHTLMGTTEERVRVSVSTIDFTISKISYDPQDLPQLPGEAHLAAHNPDMGDGTYVIKTLHDAVRITCPNGWAPLNSRYDDITLLRSDGYRAVNFSLLAREGALLNGAGLVTNYIAQLQGEDNYHSDGSSGNLDEYETAWVRQKDGIFCAYAWKNLSDNTLLIIEVIDGTGTYRSQSLLPFALDLVEGYPAT